MKKYKVSIEGTTPLVWNVIKLEIQDELKKLKKDELAEWETHNWSKKAEYDKEGNVIIPARWLKSSFINACRQTGMVPHFATTKKQTYTKYGQSLFFNDTSFKLSKSGLQPLGAFVGARGISSGTKVWKMWPKVDNWKTDFIVTDPFGRMREDELKELLEYSGAIIGIGDGRSINYGRFDVNSIKEII